MLHPHITQFALYLISGGTAAVVDFGSYSLLINLGIWYIAASIIGNILGFLTTFLCNKYFVFRKKEEFFRHLFRYTLVDISSTLLSTFILYTLVAHVGFDEEWSKLASMGIAVSWNFLLYKFCVYA